MRFGLHMRASSAALVALTFAGCLARQGTPRPVQSTPPPLPIASSAPSSAPAALAVDAAAPVAPCVDTATTPVPSESAAQGDPAPFDDGVELPHDPASPTAQLPVPFADLTDPQITDALRKDLAAFGPMSIGRAHSGVLISGVHMPEGANWQIVSPALAWGTQETVDALALAFDAVAARFSGTPRAFVGDISAKRGGHLPPHVSHQSGRDVDLGYYLTEGHHKWYAHANAASLDRPRTWHLIRTLVAESDVDLVLIDFHVQRLLRTYALEIGEDASWVDDLFQVSGKSRRPLIIHAPGHATHLHVRFYSVRAQELGRRAYRYLTSRRLIAPPTSFITHVVKPRETLSHLALRYKVTVAAIKKANGLKKDVLRVKKAYRIPQTGGISPPARVALPARRKPPAQAVAHKPQIEPCRRPAAP